MVKYILSLGTEPVENRIAPKGTASLKEHVGKEQEGRYVITASYTDKGSLVAPAGNQKRFCIEQNCDFGIAPESCLWC
jgi:cytochrome c